MIYTDSLFCGGGLHPQAVSYIFEIKDFKNGRSPADCCLFTDGDLQRFVNGGLAHWL